jgi:hypothetical protein
LRDELRVHLRACAACRRAALAVDPTLVFGALPDVEVSELELREMQQRVAGARRLLEGSRQRAATRSKLAWPAGRAAAALLLPVLVLGVWWTGSRARTVPADAAVALASAPDTSGSASATFHGQSLEQRLAGLPLVDRAEHSASEVVYQVEGASFDLVLLVDAGLELGGP